MFEFEKLEVYKKAKYSTLVNQLILIPKFNRNVFYILS